MFLGRHLKDYDEYRALVFGADAADLAALMRANELVGASAGKLHEWLRVHECKVGIDLCIPEHRHFRSSAVFELTQAAQIARAPAATSRR